MLWKINPYQNHWRDELYKIKFNTTKLKTKFDPKTLFYFIELIPKIPRLFWSNQGV